MNPQDTSLAEETKNLPFDKALQRKFEQLSFESFISHKELRSVVVVFDYVDEFNESNISKGLWLSPGGNVVDYAAVIGSLRQTLLMLDTQYKRAIDIQMQVDRTIYEKLQTLKKIEENFNARQEKGDPIT